ncbi:MAG TPA: glycosyltransferase family 2 protein [Microbacteriaceae bacterium]|nr:glycosyltransferase family 2 protein [Microbacteriaceae bacterium]
MRTLVAIPAFNEEASIGPVLDGLAAYHPLADVVVVDDGSHDRTSAIARAAGVRVLRHAINLGVGGAMGTAFRYAARHGYEVLIQFDADGQHRPEYIAALRDAVGTADIAIGSRYASSDGYQSTAGRRVVHRTIARVASLYARTRLTDATSGFRAAGPRAIAIFSAHYPVEWLGDTVESIVLASRQRLTFREVPIVMNERAGGVPSQSFVRAALYTGRILFILGLASIRSVPPRIAELRRRSAREDRAKKREAPAG